MTAAPRDPLTLLEELLPYAERLLKASCDGAHGELASAPDAMHLSELLAEIDQRLAVGAEADIDDDTMEEVLQGLRDKRKARRKALAPGERDEPAAYLFTVRRTGKGRVDQFAAIDFVPGPDDGEILAKEPLYTRPQPPAQPAPIQLTNLDKLKCRLCSDEPIGIYWIEKGCVCASDPLQALCSQHANTCEPLSEMYQIAYRAAAPQPSAQPWTAEQLAREFHDLYETAAADHGYVTRPETRAFDPESANGRLMIDVCYNILRRLSAPQPPSGWRAEVVAFANLMERELRNNEHKGGWHGMDPRDMAERVMEEAQELLDAVRVLIDGAGEITKNQIAAVAEEAADVANMAMMVADLCEAISPPPTSDREAT